MTHRPRHAALVAGTLAFYGATLCTAAEQTSSSTAAIDGPDGALEEVIVTATRTGETSLQRTALAVSVFSSDELSATHTSNIAELAQLTPSLNVGVVTASPSIYIRGVGTNNVFNGSDPDVTMQIDGVYIARPFAQFTDFFDVERIEVLRGPQGTIYGRNAVGGVVNVISKRPSDSLVGSLQLAAGDYDAFEARLYASGPVVARCAQPEPRGQPRRTWGVRRQSRARCSWRGGREHLGSSVPGAVDADEPDQRDNASRLQRVRRGHAKL
jgi:iron complex outermembrane receptor protein